MASKSVITIFLMFLLNGCGGSADGVFFGSGGNEIIGGRVGGTVAVAGNIITVAGKAAKLDGPSCVVVDSAGDLYAIDISNNIISKVTATTGIKTTVAGNGTPGYSGDGGSATSASLNGPGGIAFDGAGNFYIADSANNRIRKVSVDTGVITTVAGNGTAAYSGDGGLAISASLYHPAGIAVDSAGNLYIADTSNDRVRKVSINTGNITTVAGTNTGILGDGGLATSAGLREPNSIAFDSAGNLYILANGDNRIRKVTAATGIITTIAGNGLSGYLGDGGPATSASFSYTNGIALDSAGNVYIADYYNHAIRKVTATTGIITTVAGKCSPIDGPGYFGDDGLATSAYLNSPTGITVDSVGNLYIADYFNHAIRKVTAATGIISTMVGPGFSGDGGLVASARLSSPNYVAFDGVGNLYISDSGNNRIRKVDINTGIITTVAGNGTAGYSGDGGPATSASLYTPSGITIDSYGNIYFADCSNNRIRKVNVDTGFITTVAGNGSRLYAGGLSGDGGPATSARLSSPRGVTIDSAGNLFVADCYNDRIRKVSAATGIITTVTGNGNNSTQSGFSGDGSPATSATVAGPMDIALDSAGNLYIADTDNARIRKITAATGIITTVAGIGIAGYTGDGGLATSARLHSPSGITIDIDGNLYISDANIRKVDATTGIISTIAGNVDAGYSGDGGLATSAKLLHPIGMAIDNVGNLYIADNGNNVIRKIPH